jgi:hypothetical protein
MLKKLTDLLRQSDLAANLFMWLAILAIILIAFL